MHLHVHRINMGTDFQVYQVSQIHQIISQNGTQRNNKNVSVQNK